MPENAESAKNKNSKPSIPDYDTFSRINFLLQISKISAPISNTISHSYSSLARKISKRKVLRLDPQIKREICR